MSSDRVAAWVAIAGAHPMKELTLYGPFASPDKADKWANENVAQVGDWWIAPVWATKAEEAPDWGYARGMREHHPALCWRLLEGDRCCIQERGHDDGAHE